MNEYWLVLFVIVLLFDFIREGTFVLIYYTMWTFILEIIFLTLLVTKRKQFARKIFPFIYAPAVVVCIGFWTIIAPQTSTAPISNIVLTIVVHGINAIALITQPFKIYTTDLWKSVTYTFIYNLFLAIYVGKGGRSISGKLPYWYAQYDKPIGWIFAGLALVSVAVVHILSTAQTPKKTKSIIV